MGQRSSNGVKCPCYGLTYICGKAIMDSCAGALFLDFVIANQLCPNITVRRLRTFPVTTITNKERFDDVGPQDSDGVYEYAYHGFNYDIAVGEFVFRVRTYDSEPGIATVIS